jgi:hypothetical protein
VYLVHGTPSREPRPDSISCPVRWGNAASDARTRVVRVRDGLEAQKSVLPFTAMPTHTLVCSAAHLGEDPAAGGDGGDILPFPTPNRVTIASDPTDAERVEVGIWTYVGHADFSGIVVYETTFP